MPGFVVTADGPQSSRKELHKTGIEIKFDENDCDIVVSGWRDSNHDLIGEHYISLDRFLEMLGISKMLDNQEDRDRLIEDLKSVVKKIDRLTTKERPYLASTR